MSSPYRENLDQATANQGARFLRFYFFQSRILVIVDCFSGFFEIGWLYDTSDTPVIRKSNVTD